MYIDIKEHRSHAKDRVLRSKLESWFSMDSQDYTWAGDEQKVLDIEAMLDEETRRLWVR